MLTEYIHKDEEYPGDAEEFDTTWPAKYISYIAEDAAEHFQARYAEYDMKWPIEFTIFIDGEEAGTYSVERDFEPSFSATEVK